MGHLILNVLDDRTPKIKPCSSSLFLDESDVRYYDDRQRNRRTGRRHSCGHKLPPFIIKPESVLRVT